MTKPSVIYEEKKHLSSVLVSNGYPSSFVHCGFAIYQRSIRTSSLLPTTGIRTIFKSDMTLRSHLVRPKDTVDPAKQDGVVYRIPRECGKVYIGETGKSMQERIKEHDRDI